MKALTLTNQKIWPMYKVFAGKQLDRRTDEQTGPKLYADLLILGQKKPHSSPNYKKLKIPDSAANKDVMSKIWTNGNTII